MPLAEGQFARAYDQVKSQPIEKRRAAQISLIRPELRWAWRFPSRPWETVTALCRFTAHGAFMPSSGVKTTSDGTPRMVKVIGATVTRSGFASTGAQPDRSRAAVFSRGQSGPSLYVEFTPQSIPHPLGWNPSGAAGETYKGSHSNRRENSEEVFLFSIPCFLSSAYRSISLTCWAHSIAFHWDSEMNGSER